jgi:hypothetical protein
MVVANTHVLGSKMEAFVEKSLLQHRSQRIQTSPVLLKEILPVMSLSH